MWPATTALHHGYKAVFAPHPQYVDREWPVDFFAQTVNAGRNGESGGGSGGHPFIIAGACSAHGRGLCHTPSRCARPQAVASRLATLEG